MIKIELFEYYSNSILNFRLIKKNSWQNGMLKPKKKSTCVTSAQNLGHKKMFFYIII